MISIGTCLKLKTQILENDIADYQLPIGDNFIALNELVGKDISLKFTGIIRCIASGELIKKSFGQGYSYKSFITLAQCDLCIVKPELCHYEQGTCREPEWGLQHCFQDHVVYLSETSSPKVGITRLKNLPSRWIDQGALQAIELFRVSNRKDAGLHEIEISKIMSDKTNWRKMLTKCNTEHDLVKLKKDILEQIQSLNLNTPPILSFSSDKITNIQYPGVTASKISSLSFDKTPKIESQLMGIKGQYLIFKDGVLNMRKFQGYELEVSY